MVLSFWHAANSKRNKNDSLTVKRSSCHRTQTRQQECSKQKLRHVSICPLLWVILLRPFLEVQPHLLKWPCVPQSACMCMFIIEIAWNMHEPASNVINTDLQTRKATAEFCVCMCILILLLNKLSIGHPKSNAELMPVSCNQKGRTATPM